MNQVVIDNQKEMVEVDGKEVPRMLLWLVRGAVGKLYMVKYYLL